MPQGRLATIYASIVNSVVRPKIDVQLSPDGKSVVGVRTQGPITREYA